MMKKIGILGSTGSIGTQALDIVRENRDKFSIIALSCGSKVDLLEKQIFEFRPKVVCVEQEEDALRLKKKHPGLEVFHGKKGLKDLAGLGDYDLILNALVGMRGLEPTMSAIDSGKDIALANKESLVAGGSIVMDAAKKKGLAILPVDSEHSAIFQALKGNEGQEINRIILTASGGPFRGYTFEELEKVKLEEALKHPNWSMGSKITIDSATMMNKGLEVIEAKWLFGLDVKKIEVIVHKESIIHSMVEYIDKSVIAQMGVPDMRVPISYAFGYPVRIKNNDEGIDFQKLGQLNFEEVDTQVFRCLGLAYEAIRQGGSYPIVLNGANEVLVQQFLDKKISFIDIQTKVEKMLEDHKPSYNMDLDSVLEIDNEVRERLQKWE